VNPLSPQQILQALPYDPPMRFVSEILEVDERHIVASYTWKDEDCAGHFRNEPVVPGVKILECAAQTGCVAWGLYHLSLSRSLEEIAGYVGLFSSIEHGVFRRVLRPGQTVRAVASFGEEGYFRGNKIVSEVVVESAGGSRDGEEVFQGRLAGLWLPRPFSAPGEALSLP
jgi:3-hydroxyacyl-[acyl-carrier-protein] dehydratase